MVIDATPEAPFGRVLTAMVTPFTADGDLDTEAAARLATHLVDHGNDGLVISGTTGESPTTSDSEQEALLRAVIEAVGGRATVVAGVGTNDTRHTIELAAVAEKAGADALLVVTPYYSKPPQSGLLAHFRAVADATGLPVMLYDIPGRSGVPIQVETMLRLAEHPRIVATKDAKADLWAAQQVLHGSDLAWYSGDDQLNLPLLSIGACGLVSVTGHVVADRHRAMVEAFLAGDVARAREVNDSVVPVTTGIMTRSQGAIMAKAALELVGILANRVVRPPLVLATDEQVAVLREDLEAGGVSLERAR
jgi:4-hydroxy-tetrahydrodipicolinate synthase